MSENGDGARKDRLRPDGGPTGDRGRDDHDYEPHFSRVKESVEELKERLEAVIEDCEAVDDPSPRRRAVLDRAREVLLGIETLTDESGVMLGVGHMRLKRQVKLLEIRVRELEEGPSDEA